MRKAPLFSIVIAAAALSSLGQQSRVHGNVVAQWTFEAAVVPSLSGKPTGPSIAATTGSGSFFGKNPTSISWGNTTGNGSINGYQGDGQWQQGAYWEFDFSTTGYNSISLSFDVASKATGPRDFKVQTSTDDNVYTDLGFTYQAPLNGGLWDSSNLQSGYRIVISSLGAQFDNLPHLIVRLVQTSNASVGGSTTTVGGYSRIDNVTVQGVVSAVPEASSVWLLGAVAAITEALLFWKTRRTWLPASPAAAA
jgi:hypothetical protein